MSYKGDRENGLPCFHKRTAAHTEKKNLSLREGEKVRRGAAALSEKCGGVF